MSNYAPALGSEESNTHLRRLVDYAIEGQEEHKHFANELCEPCLTSFDEDGTHWTPNDLCKKCRPHFNKHIFSSIYALARAVGEEE